jgi:phage baseplate assembly protein W
MATFIGFNTIDQFKKFTLTDENLVIRNFLNALNIKKGELPGLPDYGTNIWNFIFDPQTPELQQAIETEIQRIVSEDPRLLVESMEFYPFNNGLRIEVSVQVVPNNDLERLVLFFDQNTNLATITI